MSRPTRPAPLPPLHALTGLRAVAALLVVLYHALPAELAGPGTPMGDTAAGAALWRAARSGYVGVSVFFVLSGFILAYNYLGELDARGAIDRGPFWTARLARVYPVYALGLLVSLPYTARHALTAAPRAWDTIASLPLAPALLQAWVPPAACQWNCPGWSLSAEAFFYAVFPFLLPPLARLARGPGGAWRLAAAAAAAWALALVPPALYGLAAGRALPWYAFDTESAATAALKFFPLLRLPEFVVGVATGVLFLRARREPNGERSAPGPSGFAPALVVDAAVLGLVAVAALALADGARLYPLLHNGLLAPVFAALVVALGSGRGLVAGALATRPARWLGQASYALYILHVPAEVWYRGIVGRAVGDPSLMHTAAGFAGYLALVTALSLAVLVGVEEPARRWIRRRVPAAGKPHPAPPAPAAAAA